MLKAELASLSMSHTCPVSPDLTTVRIFGEFGKFRGSSMLIFLSGSTYLKFWRTLNPFKAWACSFDFSAMLGSTRQMWNPLLYFTPGFLGAGCSFDADSLHIILAFLAGVAAGGDGG